MSVLLDYTTSLILPRARSGCITCAWFLLPCIWASRYLTLRCLLHSTLHVRYMVRYTVHCVRCSVTIIVMYSVTYHVRYTVSYNVGYNVCYTEHYNVRYTVRHTVCRYLPPLREIASAMSWLVSLSMPVIST